MKLPIFVKTGLVVITIALALAVTGCTEEDAKQVVEQGAHQAGDTMGDAADAVLRTSADRFATEQLENAGVDVAGDLDCRSTSGSARKPPIVVTCTGKTRQAEKIVVTARLDHSGASLDGEFVGTVAGREVFRKSS